MLKKIAESVTKPLSYNRLTNILKSSGMSIGKQTVINYVSYMTDSYLSLPTKLCRQTCRKETSPKYLLYGYRTSRTYAAGLQICSAGKSCCNRTDTTLWYRKCLFL